MAIVNITPDSFSDGGKYTTPDRVLAHCSKLVEEGADILDIGAESTRPGATPLGWEEEWQRLAPILPLIRSTFPHIPLSLDTRHAETAERGLAHGIDWLNDTSGFSTPAMQRVAANASCTLIMMHALTIPADRQVHLPETCDPVAELYHWAGERIALLEALSIHRERLIFDPGVGFGKTTSQSWEILRRTDAFTPLGIPLLVGHSRKSFLATPHAHCQDPVLAREIATFAVSAFLMVQEVAIVRVHDVAGHVKIKDLGVRI